MKLLAIVVLLAAVTEAKALDALLGPAFAVGIVLFGLRLMFGRTGHRCRRCHGCCNHRRSF